MTHKAVKIVDCGAFVGVSANEFLNSPKRAGGPREYASVTLKSEKVSFEMTQIVLEEERYGDILRVGVLLSDLADGKVSHVTTGWEQVDVLRDHLSCFEGVRVEWIMLLKNEKAHNFENEALLICDCVVVSVRSKDGCFLLTIESGADYPASGLNVDCYRVEDVHDVPGLRALQF